ncbi:hypothetical protein [Acaryochloris marina]|uniref:hypothetical protein n=1 Tax=Acaryochloris marina TaxID=155978 RepID=UPI0021C3EE3E|nr:hypothetical protein [Acaryochloris marina]BDM83806.1 hypothetical protein AM10699_66670 [Acaryochloris marina MBIC10699]
MSDNISVGKAWSFIKNNFTLQENITDLDFAKSVIATNKDALIQYSLIASNLHRSLEKCLEKLKQKNPANLNENEKNELRKLHKSLVKHLLTIQDISYTNMDLALRYFNEGERISKIAPRVCIKSIRNDDVCTVFRNDRTRNSNLPEYCENINETATFNICRQQRTVIFNDIPKDVKFFDYDNPRLNKKNAISYYDQRNNFQRRIQDKFFYPDDEWMKCWSPYPQENGVTPRSCYKSTLVVSIQVSNLDIQSLIENLVQSDDESRFSRNNWTPGTTYFGFLCFDHPMTYYFDRINDEKMGIFFSDILCPYFMYYMYYAELSPYSRLAKNLLETET